MATHKVGHAVSGVWTGDGTLTLDRCSFTGNTTADALVIRGCTFTGAWTITCGTITIDAQSFAAAVAAGVTFSSSPTVFGGGQALWFQTATGTAGQYMPTGPATVNSATSASVANTEIFFPVKMVVAFLRFYSTTSTTCTATIQKNGVDQALTVTRSGTGAGTDNAHYVVFNAGDSLNVKITGTPNGLQEVAVMAYAA